MGYTINVDIESEMTGYGTLEICRYCSTRHQSSLLFFFLSKHHAQDYCVSSHYPPTPTRSGLPQLAQTAFAQLCFNLLE